MTDLLKIGIKLAASIHFEDDQPAEDSIENKCLDQLTTGSKISEYTECVDTEYELLQLQHEQKILQYKEDCYEDAGYNPIKNIECLVEYGIDLFE